ncbi:MAG: hypothetical protein ABI581_03830 [Sediminibacterium sp.]
MINTVVYEYVDGVEPADEREKLFTKSLQMWLRPFSEEINRQKGKLILYFSADGSNGFRLEGVDKVLWDMITKQFPMFVKDLN